MLLSPVQGMSSGKGEIKLRITQKFGNDFKLNGKWVYKSMGMDGHNGIDYGVPVGTPIFASHDGIVTRIKKDETGYGWHVRIRSHHFARETIYAHLSEILVNEGQHVGLGDKIALSGGARGAIGSGLSTAPHLHFGYRNLLPSSADISRWYVKDYNNGYFGWKDVLPYLIEWEGTHTQKKLV